MLTQLLVKWSKYAHSVDLDSVNCPAITHYCEMAKFQSRGGVSLTYIPPLKFVSDKSSFTCYVAHVVGRVLWFTTILFNSSVKRKTIVRSVTREERVSMARVTDECSEWNNQSEACP